MLDTFDVPKFCGTMNQFRAPDTLNLLLLLHSKLLAMRRDQLPQVSLDSVSWLSF